MPKNIWLPLELAFVQRLVQQGLNIQQIVDELQRAGIKRTYKAVKNKIDSERERNPEAWLPKVAPSPFPIHNEQLTVRADKALLLFDVHAPFHDAAWINRVVTLAVRRGVRAVVIGGDLVDFSAFSPYGRQVGVEAEAEIRATTQIIKALHGAFDEVYYIGGNHEMRLVRRTAGLFGLADVMELFLTDPRTKVSDYQWLELLSGGERFYVEHPANASIRPTAVARDLCGVHLCHIISGHGHLWGMTRDDSGRFWAIEAGICADPRRLEYQAKRHSRRPSMLQGAVIVEDGIPILLGPWNIALWERLTP